MEIWTFNEISIETISFFFFFSALFNLVFCQLKDVCIFILSFSAKNLEMLMVVTTVGVKDMFLAIISAHNSVDPQIPYITVLFGRENSE